jgi:hypothetical protein
VPLSADRAASVLARVISFQNAFQSGGAPGFDTEKASDTEYPGLRRKGLGKLVAPDHFIISLAANSSITCQ